MSIRSAQRQVAKARMAALGIDQINRKMGPKIRYTRGTIRKMMRTRLGRQDKEKYAELESANWRRVLMGDLAEAAEKAQIGDKKHRKDGSGSVARKIRRIRKVSA